MSLSKQQQTFTLNASKLIQYIFSKNYSCTFGDAYRSPEQAEIYAKQGKGIQDSLHCQRLAVDLNLFSPDGIYLSDAKEYEQFGIFWESLDPLNRWGGRFKMRNDANHFEMREK